MPRKASARRTAAGKSQAASEEAEDYERVKRCEIALSDLANEVDKQMKMIDDEAKEIINLLHSTYAHCLSALTKEEKEMLWVDYEARHKPSAAAAGDAALPGVMADKALNHINVKIPEVDVLPVDRKGRRKHPAKGRKGAENAMAAADDAEPLAKLQDDSKRGIVASAVMAAAPSAVATVSSSREFARCAAATAVPETPATGGFQFNHLMRTVSNTERRPKPKEKIALASASTGSPLSLEQRVCILVDGQDVLDLKSGEISTHDVQYLQNILARLKQQATA